MPVKNQKTTKLNTSKPAAWHLPVIVFVAIVMIVVVTAIGTYRYLYNARLPLEPYSNRELGFEMMIPRGWQAHEANEFSQVTFLPGGMTPDQQDSLEQPEDSIAIVRLDGYQGQSSTADTFFEEVNALLKQNIDSQALSDESNSLESQYKNAEPTRLRIGGHQAMLVSVDIDNFGYRQGETGHGTIAYIYKDSQRQYTIAASSLDKSSAFGQQHQRILKTFRSL